MMAQAARTRAAIARTWALSGWMLLVPGAIYLILSAVCGVFFLVVGLVMTSVGGALLAPSFWAQMQGRPKRQTDQADTQAAVDGMEQDHA